MLILALVLVVINSKPEKSRYDHRIFSLLVLATAIAVLLDIAMFWLDGQTGQTKLLLNKLVTPLYFIFNPLVAYIWSLYSDLMIHRSEQRVRQRALLLSIPTLVVAVLSVISLWNGMLFSIDNSNVYHRGPFFMLMAVLSYFYLMYSLALIITNRNSILHTEFLPMIFFIIPPTIGGIIQIIFFGTSIIWISITFSVLIVFIYILNQSIATDHLTGLYNRRALDAYLDRIVQAASARQQIAGMMIDLNNMKAINDQYGHQAGDLALERAAEILRQSLRKDDFIARYGGDEFAVLFLAQDKDALCKALQRLERNVGRFNERSELPFCIAFSIGSGIFDPSVDHSIEAFMKRLDEKMYEAKPDRQPV